MHHRRRGAKSEVKATNNKDHDPFQPGQLSTMSLIFVFILRQLLRLINLFYIPLFLIRPFRKHKAIAPIDNRILMFSAEDLAEKIRNKELSSESIIKTYIRRIKQVNPILNAIIDNRFPEALQEAQKADKLIESNKYSVDELKTKFPLLGVPISVKGSIAIKGLKNSSGTVFKTRPSEEDADIILLVKQAGGIPLVTTNVPELCMNWETYNKLIGTTRNPYDTRRTVGGSSGGEAALLASAGSIVGLGSDVAGSLRLPAHFCGVYGHKPTPGVVSFQGHYPSCLELEDWTKVFTLGPMARYARDLPLLLNVITKPASRKSLQLDNPVPVNKLKVFFIEQTNCSLGNKLDPEILQVLHQVISALNENLDTSCTKLKIPLLDHAGGMAYLKLGEIKNVENLFPNCGKGVFSELFRFITCRSNSMLLTISYGLLRKFHFLIPNSLKKLNELNLEKLQGQLEHVLDENSVLILPSYPEVASYHRDVYRKLFNAGYLAIFNALGYPVTNCPVGLSSKGLPIGLQVVSAPYCDRLSIAMAVKLESLFGGWKPPGIQHDV